MENEKELIEKLFYVITPELVSKFIDLWGKYKKNPDFNNIIKKELNIDHNLVLYLYVHIDGFDCYFNEENSVRFYKLDKELRVESYDKDGNILPQYDNETIYVKKTDLI